MFSFACVSNFVPQGFISTETNRCDKSEDDGFQAVFEDDSCMGSMIVVGQKEGTAVDVIYEKSRIHRQENSLTRFENTKQNIETENQQGDEVLSDEFMKIYRNHCLTGVPFLRWEGFVRFFVLTIFFTFLFMTFV